MPISFSLNKSVSFQAKKITQTHIHTHDTEITHEIKEMSLIRYSR